MMKDIWREELQLAACPRQGRRGSYVNIVKIGEHEDTEGEEQQG